MARLLLPLLLAASLTVGCGHTSSLVLVSKAEALPAPVEGPLQGALIGEVNDDSVKPLIAQLQTRPATYFLLIDSEGGYVSSGLDLILAMQSAQNAGTEIVCAVPERGLAASMAATILMQCDYRLGHKSAIYLFHTVRVSNVGGTQWDLERVASELAQANAQLLAMICWHLTISCDELERRTHDRDYWFGTATALEIGALDAELP